MDTIYGIVAAVISGVIVRFVFEILLDAYIRPKRQYYELRGKVSYYIEEATAVLFYLPNLQEDILNDNDSHNYSFEIDEFHQKVRETHKQLNQLASEVGAFYETLHRKILGMPEKDDFQRVAFLISEISSSVNQLRTQDTFDESLSKVEYFEKTVAPINRIKELLKLRDVNQV